MKQFLNFSPNYYDNPEFKKKQHEELIDHLLSSDDDFYNDQPIINSKVKRLKARTNRYDHYETTFGPSSNDTVALQSYEGKSLSDAELTESRKLFEDFKAKTKIISDEFNYDNKYNKLSERLEGDFYDDKFDEYIKERIDYQRYIDMQKEKYRRFIIEEIAANTPDKRTPDEKKFYTWHLKFKMPFFKQYGYDHLRVLTDKFSFHAEGPLSF